MAGERNPRRRSEPRASRPHMPGYGILDAASGKGLLRWTWATERISLARTYWIATTRPGGAPHTMPVWGVWLDDAFYFSTGPDSRKARNIAANPQCVVSSEYENAAVILEGVAEKVIEESRIRPFINAYNAKYKWNMDGSEGPIYAVRPRVAFAFVVGGDAFVSTATRWRFDDN